MLDKNLEGDRFLTSEERRRQHGDRRRLGVLKKEQRNESKKRKVLKLEDSVCSKIFANMNEIC